MTNAVEIKNKKLSAGVDSLERNGLATITEIYRVKRERLLVEGNLAQYLYISLRSQLFNYFAHQKVQSKYVDFLGVYADGFAAEESDFSIREKQLSDYIEGEIQKLPAKMRAVFELSRKDGLSNKEIANLEDIRKVATCFFSKWPLFSA